jgi:hypothetical protein
MILYIHKFCYFNLITYIHSCHRFFFFVHPTMVRFLPRCLTVLQRVDKKSLLTSVQLATKAIGCHRGQQDHAIP